jgi:uncharacterized protein (DUF736 family)
MPSIGYFRKDDKGYEGDIVTLSVQARGVRIVPETSPSENEDAPTHRVFVGRAEIGAAWPSRGTESGTDYLSLKLDDPSFKAPIYANLIDDEGSDTATLLWSVAR